MTYEIILELQKAQFPYSPKGYPVFRYAPDLTSGSQVPSLDELVEACGDELKSIEFLHGQNRVIANGYSVPPQESVDVRDAVALLWLSLQKK